MSAIVDPCCTRHFSSQSRNMGMTMRFELYRDAGGAWRWRLRATNGNVLADSAEGYARREDCEHGIALVKGSQAASIVDMTLKIA